MPISYFDLRDIENPAEFSEKLTSLKERLAAARERMFLLGLPCSGKLEKNFNTLISSLDTLLQEETQTRSYADEKNAALQNLDILGPFVNLEVGPGKIRIRDLMTEPKKKEDRQKLEEELKYAGENLEIETGANVEPLYNYRTENRLDSVSFEDFENRIERHNPRVAYNNLDSFHQVSEILYDLADSNGIGDEPEKLKGESDKDYKKRVSEKEAADLDVFTKFRQWSRHFSCIYTGQSRSNNEYFGFDKKIPINSTPKTAFETLKSGEFSKFLNEKMTFEGQEKTVREWMKDIADKKGVDLDAALKDVEGKLGFNMEGKTPVDLESPIERLKKDPLVQKYFEEKGIPEEARVPERAAFAKDFKKFLAQQPPMALTNNPALVPFLPTYKSRIEQLQKQIKKNASPEFRTKAMAEIVILRNMAVAVRGEKDSLDKPISADESSSLTKSAEILASKPDFAALCRETAKYAVDGHGGKMVDEMRKATKRRTDPLKADEITNSFVYTNTYQGRVNRLKLEAGKMLETLELHPENFNKMKRAYMNLALEMHSINDTVKLSKKPLANIDWERANYVRDHLRKSPAFQLESHKKFSIEDMKKGLQAMNRSNNFGFVLGQALPHKERESKLELDAQNIGPIMN